MGGATGRPGAGPSLAVDLCFDLDLALTPSPYTPSAAPSPDQLIAILPTSPAAAVCTVCMEGCEGGKQTPCGHIFHGACISSWLGLRNSCPLCRRRVLSEV